MPRARIEGENIKISRQPLHSEAATRTNVHGGEKKTVSAGAGGAGGAGQSGWIRARENNARKRSKSHPRASKVGVGRPIGKTAGSAGVDWMGE